MIMLYSELNSPIKKIQIFAPWITEVSAQASNYEIFFELFQTALIEQFDNRINRTLLNLVELQKFD